MKLPITGCCLALAAVVSSGCYHVKQEYDPCLGWMYKCKQWGFTKDGRSPCNPGCDAQCDGFHGCAAPGMSGPPAMSAPEYAEPTYGSSYGPVEYGPGPVHYEPGHYEPGPVQHESGPIQYESGPAEYEPQPMPEPAPAAPPAETTWQRRPTGQRHAAGPRHAPRQPVRQAASWRPH